MKKKYILSILLIAPTASQCMEQSNPNKNTQHITYGIGYNTQTAATAHAITGIIKMVNNMRYIYFYDANRQLICYCPWKYESSHFGYFAQQEFKKIVNIDQLLPVSEKKSTLSSLWETWFG